MAYDFNGTTAKIDFGDVTFLDGLATFSCHCWLNMATMAHSVIVEKINGATQGFRFDVDDGSQFVTDGIMVTYEDGSANEQLAASANGAITIASGWQSAGFSFEKVATGLKTRVGGTAGTGTPVTTFDSMQNNAQSLILGAHHAGTNFIEGAIAELAFWNRVLTDQEWTNLAAGLAPTLCAPGGIVFYARLLNNAIAEIGGVTGTITAATPTTHPTIVYPGAIAFIATANGGTLSTTSFSVTLPTTQAGDLLLLEFSHRGTGDGTVGGTYTGPALTLKHSQLFNVSGFSGKTYWSRATGNHAGETMAVTGLTNSCAGIVTVYRSALATGDPLTAATIVGEENPGADETQAQITTTVDNAMVVLALGLSPDIVTTGHTCTSPGALTERASCYSTGGTNTTIIHTSAKKATAGATGAFTWAGTNAVCGSWVYAIQPAAVGGGGGSTHVRWPRA